MQACISDISMEGVARPVWSKCKVTWSDFWLDTGVELGRGDSIYKCMENMSDCTLEHSFRIPQKMRLCTAQRFLERWQLAARNSHFRGMNGSSRGACKVESWVGTRPWWALCITGLEVVRRRGLSVWLRDLVSSPSIYWEPYEETEPISCIVEQLNQHFILFYFLFKCLLRFLGQVSGPFHEQSAVIWEVC